MKPLKSLIFSGVFFFFCLILLKVFKLRSTTISHGNIYIGLILGLSCFLVLLFIRSKKAKNTVKDSLDILELCDDGIIILDQALNVTYLNSAFASFLGLGKVYKKLFYDLEVKKSLELFEHIKDLLKRSYQYQTLLRENITLKNSPITFEVTLIPLEEKQGFAIFVKDTTKNVRSVSMGKDFIANATHELRTPITIIKGFIETLTDLPQVSEAMLDEISDKILRSCNRMDRIVKNLLILTDLDHLSKAQFKNFDLEALIDNCSHTLYSIFPDAKVSLTCLSKDSKTFADPDLLELAIMNLMQNAVKYSPGSAIIDITIDKKGHDVVITIADHGQGIPKEFQESIFERFATVDKTASRKLGGAGLGLSIVKTIVEKHGGKIHASSNPGGGAKFIMSLPKEVS